MLKKLAHAVMTAFHHFCAAELAAAWLGEVRDVAGEPTVIYHVASRINEEVASGDGYSVEEMPVEVVVKSVPDNRKAFVTATPAKVQTIGAPVAAAERRLSQPILLMRDETSDTGFWMIDGLIRLNDHIARGEQTIRCFILSREFVNEHGHMPLGDLWSQRTVTETMPSATRPPQPAVGMSAPKVGMPVISAAHQQLRYLNPNAVHPDGLSLVPDAITAATTDQERGRVVVGVDSIIPEPTDRKRLRREDQKNLAVELTYAPHLIHRPEPAAMSYPQLVLILYILTLFQFIRRHATSVRSYELGHGILRRDPRYAAMVGAPKDLQKSYNVWKALRPGGSGPWCKPLHQGLVDLGIRWRAKHGVDAPPTLYDHGIELVETAFKVLVLANKLRSNVRKVHSFNFRGSNGDDWRAILERAVDGIVYKATRGDYEVYWPNRALLALHGRFNPAKIWRDTTRDTLLYEWLIAIGDLARTSRMVVTCHMAQALFIADDIRSEPGQENAISPEWDLFDQTFEMIAGDKVRYTSLRRDLILHCAQAMRGKCAIVLTLSKDGTAGFSAKELSLQESILADTLILHS